MQDDDPVEMWSIRLQPTTLPRAYHSDEAPWMGYPPGRHIDSIMRDYYRERQLFALLTKRAVAHQKFLVYG